MRRGEILELKWEDVDLDQRLIRVRLTKNKRTRYIPINESLMAVLTRAAALRWMLLRLREPRYTRPLVRQEDRLGVHDPAGNAERIPVL